MFSTKPKATVKSVFAKFTTDLEQVTAQQQVVADDAVKAQGILKASLVTQVERQASAESEIAQAGTAIKNIGELLGIKAN